MNSERLAGKVMRLIAMRPMIEWVIRRSYLSEHIDDAVIATTDTKADKPLVRFMEKWGYKVITGPEDNVLERYRLAASRTGAGHIVRITGDCPLIDPSQIDNVVQSHIETVADYSSNCGIKYELPRGLDVEVFKRRALDRACREAKEGYELEHVTPYFYQHPELFRLNYVRPARMLRRTDLRLCVDTEEDLKLVRKVYSHFRTGILRVRTSQIYGYLDSKPELKAINSQVEQRKLPTPQKD